MRKAIVTSFANFGRASPVLSFRTRGQWETRSLAAGPNPS